jgi:hypothetical protein
VQKFSEQMVPVDDRMFEVAGQEFRWVYPGWDEFADRLDTDSAAVAARSNGAVAQEGEEEEAGDEHAVREMYLDYAKRIEEFIDPDWNDGLTRWRSLVKPAGKKKSPVPAYLLQAIWRWLLEVTTDSPTKLPSASADGQPETDDTSKDASS